MNNSTMHVVAIAALAFGSILAEHRPTFAQPSASSRVDTTFSGASLLVAQTPSPAAPIGPAPSPEKPLGLPRVRDYEPIPELRDVYFDLGTAAIRPGDANILAANAAWLRANPNQLVLIEGHCDNRGATTKKNELNMDLGERRAQAAMDYLVARGIPASRITVLSYGEERPQCAENSERCWSQNRRSRFLVKPHE